MYSLEVSLMYHMIKNGLNNKTILNMFPQATLKQIKFLRKVSKNHDRFIDKKNTIRRKSNA